MHTASDGRRKRARCGRGPRGDRRVDSDRQNCKSLLSKSDDAVRRTGNSPLSPCERQPMKLPLLDLSFMHGELDKELDEAWQQVSRSAKFIGGEFVERFEAQWAAYCGTTHCVGVSSGTAAL